MNAQRDFRLVSLEEARTRNFADPYFVASYESGKKEEYELHSIASELLPWIETTDIRSGIDFYSDLRSASNVVFEVKAGLVLISFAMSTAAKPSLGAVIRSVTIDLEALLRPSLHRMTPVLFTELIRGLQSVDLTRINGHRWSLKAGGANPGELAKRLLSASGS